MSFDQIPKDQLSNVVAWHLSINEVFRAWLCGFCISVVTKSTNRNRMGLGSSGVVKGYSPCGSLCRVGVRFNVITRLTVFLSDGRTRQRLAGTVVRV